jgi:hypothetical protein
MSARARLRALSRNWRQSPTGPPEVSCGGLRGTRGFRGFGSTLGRTRWRFASTLRQPHDCDAPLRRLSPRTIVRTLASQSHRQTHRAAPAFEFLALATTSRRPNRCPSMSRSLADGALSLLILILQRPKRRSAMLCPIARGARALRCEQVIATYRICGVDHSQSQQCILKKKFTAVF